MASTFATPVRAGSSSCGLKFRTPEVAPAIVTEARRLGNAIGEEGSSLAGLAVNNPSVVEAEMEANPTRGSLGLESAFSKTILGEAFVVGGESVIFVFDPRFLSSVRDMDYTK